ncbi:translation initiation factor IF-2 [Candidatus Woesearchaeota archaeon]|nr:translation initiation factor IF-2 [Candidatus Woesearchaeota archaeon]
MLRQLIVSLLGNVDSGKSQTIDCIKKTSIVTSEPGKITQSIKAYSISLQAIKDICKDLLDLSKIKVPGLLFIDLPGHKAFSNLRKRGGSLADIAILVVDINEGLKPQTIEAIEILKENKTPFVIALNKLDLVNGWRSNLDLHLIKSIASQSSSVQKLLDDKIYSLVAALYKNGLSAERFDRVEDFTKQLVMIPMSAKTGEGIPELLMLITGLAQKFLESQLSYDPETSAEGTILEITEEKGLGLCMDVIVYKGKVRINDAIVVGTLSEPIATKIKALFLVEKNQLKSIKEAEAAIGVKISAQNIDQVIPGMPFRVANKDLEKTKIEIKKQVEEITIELDKEGVVIKADTLGSLEALIGMLREKNIKVKRASIGDINKKDIAEALSSLDQLNKIILGFNVRASETNEVKTITDNIIYSLIDKFDEWYNSEKKAIEEKLMGNVPKPCKIKILEGYIFRQSSPAVCGIEVLSGVLKNGINLMKDDKSITEVKELQHEGKKLTEAKRGEQLAISMPGITIGRQVKEGDILYSDLTEEQFRIYKKMKKLITDEDVNILKEIAELKRKNNPGWGI